MTSLKIATLSLAALAFLTGSASAQQYTKPWGFQPQNRAQLAIIMRQIEEGGGSTGSGAAGSGSTTIVCGGGGSTAQANNTCIILNNADGMINTDQAATGEQTATSVESSSVNADSADADDILSVLSGSN